MRKFLLTVAVTLLGCSGFGALSPLSQSLVEMRALLESPSLSYHLPQGEPVTSISRHADAFTVLTPDQEMIVKIEYQQQKMLGPKQFKLIFNEPTAR